MPPGSACHLAHGWPGLHGLCPAVTAGAWMLPCSDIAPATAQHHSHHPEQTLSQLSLPPDTPVTESSSHPVPQATGAMPAPHISSPVHPRQPPVSPCPASSTSPPLLPLGTQALFSPLRATASRERRSPQLSNTHSLLLPFAPRKPHGAGP